MQRPLRVLATATLLAMLFLASFASQPANAGTEAAPEITDPANDQKSEGTIPACPAPPNVCQFSRGDVVLAWIEESGSDLIIHIKTALEIGGGSAGGQDTTAYEFFFHMTAGGTEAIASAVTTASAVTPGGVASAATGSGFYLNLTVPRTALAAATAGSVLSSLFVDVEVFPLANRDAVLGGDRAPDGTAFGTDYTLAGGSGSTNSTDTDADGLNDTWEQANFSNLNQTAGDDADSDGCTNACEQQTGTDPNNADTDGDGVSDGDEIKAGTDPTAPDNGTTTTTSGPPTSDTSTSGPPTSNTPTSPGPGGSDGGERSLGDRFSDAFSSGYLIIAGVLALVVIILSLVARGVRWGL